MTVRQVLWGALILRLAFLPLLPGLTDDLYRYIWDGWIQIHGINPYRYPPKHEALAAFQSSFIYDHLNSQPYYSVYPPLSQLFFAIGGWFHSVDWTVSYYVLKVLFTGTEFGGVVLLSRLATARNLLLYAWNPLVLLETAGQGHTEALLVFFLVGTVWAVRAECPRYASLFLVGGGLVKLYPFVLWPYLVRRYGMTALWPGAIVGVGLCVPYAASYVLPNLKASVDLFAQLFEFNAGLYYATKYVGWAATGADWSKVIGPAFRYLFLGALLPLYILDWWRGWSFRRATVLTVGLFLVLSTTVHPWYLLPLLALGVVPERPAWAWIWIAAVSIGTYLFYVDGPYWIWIGLGWGGGGLIGLGFFLARYRWAKQLLHQYSPVGNGGAEASVYSDS
ncbi:MAG: hypothetical protein BRD55_08980 [Bacteroidetes bacterium SW_9_63_38]|nr:MAG: hypothetical protein BRD55_08980 [Bacteroidetes bacterium SW_9_63_38]